MDPYLEHPRHWANLHQSLVTYLRDTLNAELPPGYYAAANERLYVGRTERTIYPDVTLTQARLPIPASGRRIAVLAADADQAWELPEEIRTFREPFVEIISLQPERRVVTAIEVLSPANKRKGSTGRSEYLVKQDETIRAAISLLELDFLRGGEHTVAASLESLHARGEWTYLVCLSDANRQGACSVWPINLRQTLPRVRVPLGGDDPPVIIALQPLMEHAFAMGRFAEVIDYHAEPPPPPLSEEDAAWVAERLRPVSEEA
jgi:hypothetical protein